MFPQLLQYSDVGLFLLRAVVAIIFITHGLPKLLKSKMMADGMGVPSFVVILLGSVETLASVGLVLGVYTQFSAMLLGLVMIGAIKMKALKWGVPFSAMDKTGWEFDLILLSACLAIVLGGGGPIGL